MLTKRRAAENNVGDQFAFLAQWPLPHQQMQYGPTMQEAGTFAEGSTIAVG